MTSSDESLYPFFALAQQTQRKALQVRRRKLARRAGAQRKPKAPSGPPSRAPQQKIGDRYEQAAWELLEHAGYQLLARQLACPLGELDLVVRTGAELVFVEVRQRSSARFGGAAASISVGKQQRLIRAAQWWLPTLARRHFGGQMPKCRLDIIAFEPDGAIWHRDAIRLTQDK